MSHRVESPDFGAYKDNNVSPLEQGSPPNLKKAKTKYAAYTHYDKSFKKSVMPITINSKFENKKMSVVEKKPQDSPKAL